MLWLRWICDHIFTALTFLGLLFVDRRKLDERPPLQQAKQLPGSEHGLANYEGR
jgi:hypothetical protein